MQSVSNPDASSVRKITAEGLSRLDQSSFISVLGDIFEHSPWVAEGAWPFRPFADADALHKRMVEVVRNASRRAQHDLICAHPDLAGKAAIAGEITDASKREQAGSGLGSLTKDEFVRFQELNTAYKAKFGFPFIMAVRGNIKTDIMAGFAERLKNSPDQEFERALGEIAKIAGFRLHELIPG
ncbi:MAG: 2-oxo-4-hydroxy-4-carboxy-5-ureidoimidazoline decarboxylase [Terriglobales bacterium]